MAIQLRYGKDKTVGPDSSLAGQASVCMGAASSGDGGALYLGSGKQAISPCQVTTGSPLNIENSLVFNPDTTTLSINYGGILRQLKGWLDGNTTEDSTVLAEVGPNRQFNQGLTAIGLSYDARYSTRSDSVVVLSGKIQATNVSGGQGVVVKSNASSSSATVEVPSNNNVFLGFGNGRSGSETVLIGRWDNGTTTARYTAVGRALLGSSRGDHTILGSFGGVGNSEAFTLMGNLGGQPYNNNIRGTLLNHTRWSTIISAETNDVSTVTIGWDTGEATGVIIGTGLNANPTTNVARCDLVRIWAGSTASPIGTGNKSTIIGANPSGSGNVVSLGAYNTVRWLANSDGAWFFSGSSGTSGQVLVSNGTGSPPSWKARQVTSFTSADGKLVVIESGIITRIES